MVALDRLRSEFVSAYGRTPRLFSAPGRVNLIGEHTDYNDGYVMPLAIERRTYVAALPNGTSKVRGRSLNFGDPFEFDLERPGPPRRGIFLDYLEGTARALLARGLPVVGVDLLIDSDVPAGAGVSASAALELSVGLALAVLGGTPSPDKVTLALAGQAAEHEYVGTMCGIMDQYIAALGQRDHALLIDCRTLETTAVPVKLDGVSVLVCDTRAKHELSTSEYNVRRRECDEAVELLAARLPGITALRDVSVADFEIHQAVLPDVVARRARHVVTENARTLAAAAALQAGDLRRVGQLMQESHASLRSDYAVSSDELDCAVDAAIVVSGVFGARMTGGGFGGCTVSLVESTAVPAVERAVKAAFAARGFKEPELFATTACEGARGED